MSKQKTVELIPAFVFDCPECGVENFVRTIVAQFSEDEMNEMRWEHGVDPLEEGLFLTSPKYVTCETCKTKFETVHFGDEGEDL